MTTLPLDRIHVGKRARIDLGDINELVDSIKAVGLLHPIVVTKAHILVAGGRRLEACRRLGWTEVPVTVIDLDSAATAFRAEMEENTCRKALSPIEASKLRETIAQALAPEAEQRKIEGQKAGGRARQLASKLDASSPTNTSSKLDEPEKHAATQSARATRKAAAIPTGYSGSTLDKVDRVREVAERGTITTLGVTKPVPEAVQSVARQSVTALHERTSNPSKAVSDVERAIESIVASDPDIQRHQLRKDTFAALGKACDLLALNPSEVASVTDDKLTASINRLTASLTEWHQTFTAALPKRGHLTLAKGGLQ